LLITDVSAGCWGSGDIMPKFMAYSNVTEEYYFANDFISLCKEIIDYDLINIDDDSDYVSLYLAGDNYPISTFKMPKSKDEQAQFEHMLKMILRNRGITFYSEI